MKEDLQPQEGTMQNHHAAADVDAALATTLLTVVGFASYWTALCAILLSDAFAPASDQPMTGFLLRMLLLVGFGAVQLLSHTRLPDVLDTHRRRTAIRVASFACICVLGVFSLVADQSSGWLTAAQVVVWVALGMAMGQSLVFWGVVWSSIDAERDNNSFCSVAIAVSVVAAAVACSVMLFAPHALCLAAGIAFFGASALLQQLCGKRIAPIEEMSSAASRGKLNLRGAQMLTPAGAGFGIGVALALNGLRLGVHAAFPTALIGIGAGAFALMLIIALRGATPAPSSIERAIFPLMCACFLLLPFLESTLAFQAVMALLLADLTVYLANHWNILVLLAYRKHLKPLYHFGQGLIATTVPAALGWAIVAVPAAFASDQMAPYAVEGWSAGGVPPLLVGTPINLTLVTCLTAVLACVIVLSIVPYASNQLVEGLFAQDATEKDVGASDQAASWQKACQDICEERGLTPREREVFVYLTRGRNADHIAGELVISVHTAKTHTARIYRKLGINSQQQLIDMVEQRSGTTAR